jgi:putative CocE/NonD family hydrolase
MDCVSRYSFIIFIFFIQVGKSQVISLAKVGFETSQGIYLESDICLPDTLGAYPVILLRTPYGKYQYNSFGQYFAEAGFVTIVQDVRGKFGSSGEFFPFYHEQEDGLATLDWIVEQPWCNGKIGMYGVSYPAFCALTLATDQHPALQAIVNVSGWVKPTDMATEGRALHLLLNLPWLLHEETLTTRDMADYNIDSLLWHLPVKDAMNSVGIKSKAWEESNLLD